MKRSAARLFLSNILTEFAMKIIGMMHQQYINNQPFSDSQLKGWVTEYVDKILANSNTD